MFDAEGTIILPSAEASLYQFVTESIHQSHMMHASVSTTHLNAEMQSFFEQNVALKISCLFRRKHWAS
uniref:Uncharacterized protein n=1 Tax=Setaria viridis TaxID=4556 RepID=A0A4U6VMK0_SETVI|nr:hypothetical protein SEVIR_3G360150v2 [Setaria viridis]